MGSLNDYAKQEHSENADFHQNEYEITFNIYHTYSENPCPKVGHYTYNKISMKI